MRRRIVVLSICLSTSLVSPTVGAFNVDGLWSGMSREQALAGALRLGLQVRNEGERVLVAPPGAPWAAATLGFCGSLLSSYRRNLASDADYASTLSRVFAAFGPPRLMSFRGDVTTDMDTASGAMQSYVITEWVRGDDRVQLKSYFDWRTHKGNLGRFQPATIAYETRSPCNAR